MSNVQITRTAAVALFTALGIKAAEKWNGKRMAAKLAKIDEMVDDDVNLPKAEDATLTTVLQAIEDERVIEVVEAAKGKSAPEPEPEEEEEGVVDEQAEALEALKNRHDAGELTAKQYAAERKKIMAKKPSAKTEKAPAKTPKPKAEKAPKPTAQAKAEKTLGVRKNTNTRPYMAGQVLAKHGFDSGITDEMVAELNVLYGKENDAESFGRLRSAWHSVQGYLENVSE